MTHKDIIERAESLGLKFKRNMKSEDIMLLIEEAELAGKEPVLENNVKKDNVTKTSIVKNNIIQPTKIQKSNTIRTAQRMVRCIIVPLVETMRSINSEMYAVGTKSTGFVKKVVRFNEETIEPMIIVKHLMSKTMLLQIDNGKNFQVKLRRTPAFNIKILPDYTKKELDDLFAKGKASK